MQSLLTAASILWFAMLSSLLEAEVRAATCNKCESDLDSRCGSTLSYSPPTCYDTTCFTFTGTYDGTYVIARDCLSTSASGCRSVDTYYQGHHIIGTYCFCQYGYCNGGQWSGGNPPPVTTPTTTTTTTAVATVPRWLTCYQCDSLHNSQCVSTASGAKTCENKMCYTFVGTVDGTYIVLRDCASSTSTGCGSVSLTSGGVKLTGQYCYCASNYCNRDAVRSGGNAVEIVGRGSFAIVISAAISMRLLI